MVWVGNFHEGYKASPEAQRLVGWASGRASHSMQQADNRHSAYPTSSQHAKAMHTYIRQAADGSSIVVFDVSFPHGLSTSVEEVSSAPQASGSNASAAIGSSDMIPQRKFHPANAAVADWQAPLDAVCHSQCRIAASGPGRVAVTAPVEIAQVICHLQASAFASKLWLLCMQQPAVQQATSALASMLQLHDVSAPSLPRRPLMLTMAASHLHRC